MSMEKMKIGMLKLLINELIDKTFGTHGYIISSAKQCLFSWIFIISNSLRASNKNRFTDFLV